MGGTEPFDPVARSMRGGHGECWHFGAAAVALPDGRPVARLGDPKQPVWLRSVAKPFQAVPLVAAGGEERWRLEGEDLALICASHGGRREHLARVEKLLQRGGFAIEDLQCGAHPPLDREWAERLVASGAAPEPLHNSCSGKHAGMLLACRLLGLDPASYLAPDHPLQEKILVEIAAFGGLDPDGIDLAVDGCSLPTYRLPLAAVARAYAALADPRSAGLADERRAAAERVTVAMTGSPSMVAGTGRFTTRLMEVTGGRLLGKEGALGLYGVAVRAPRAMGVAVKIADGSDSCRDGVVVEVLRQLGVLGGPELESLADFHRPPVRNHRGWMVGELVPELELHEVGEG